MLPAARAQRTGNKRQRDHSVGPFRAFDREFIAFLPHPPPASSPPRTATVSASAMDKDRESEDESAHSSQSSKRRRESYAEHDNDRLGPCKEIDVQRPKTTCNLRDWEALKTLFDHAVHAFDNGDAHAAAHLLHAVLEECNRFLTFYQDPSVLFTENSSPGKKRRKGDRKRHLSTTVLSPGLTPQEEKLRRDWGFADYAGDMSGRGDFDSDGMDVESDAGYTSRPGTSSGRLESKKESSSHKQRPKEHPTAFHTLFGSALLLYGILVARAQVNSAGPTPAATGEARTSPDTGGSEDSTPSTSTQQTLKKVGEEEKTFSSLLRFDGVLQTESTNISYPRPQAAVTLSRPFPLPRTHSDSSEPSSSSMGPNTPQSGPSSLSSFTHPSTHSPFPRPSTSPASPLASRPRSAPLSPAQGPGQDARYYWYAALDVFEAGENVPARTSEGSAPTLQGDEPTLRHTHNVFDHPFHTDFPGVRHGRRAHHKHDRMSRQVSGDVEGDEGSHSPEELSGERERTSSDEETRHEARRQARLERKEREAARERDVAQPSSLSAAPYSPAVSEKEDWRMAVAWGRTLVCLAQVQTTARLEPATEHGAEDREDLASPLDFDCLFPNVFLSALSPEFSSSSPSSRPPSSHEYFPTFHPLAPSTAPAPTPIAVSMPNRPNTPSSLSTAGHHLSEHEGAHELLVRAMDQFARALLYVPRTSPDDPLASMPADVMNVQPEAHLAFVSPFAYSSPTSPSPLAAAYAIPLSASVPLASHAYLLLSVASSVLVVAAGLSDPEQRAYWGRWAEGIINVVGISSLPGLGKLFRGVDQEEVRPKTPTEEAELRVRTDLTRARCWLMVADAKFELLKDAAEAVKQVGDVESGKSKEDSDLVHDCREAFRKAIDLLTAVGIRAQSISSVISLRLMPEDKLQESVSFLISYTSKMLDILGHPSPETQTITKEGYETTLDSVLLSASSSGKTLIDSQPTDEPARSPSVDRMEEDI